MPNNRQSQPCLVASHGGTGSGHPRLSVALPAQQAQATIAGVFPDGRSVTLYQHVVPGNTTITQPIANIGGTLGMRTVRLTASIQGGEITATADCTFTVAAAPLHIQRLLAVGDPVPAMGQL